MAYESHHFVEHHEVRIPVLKRLIELGWKREQIVCPSDDSVDKEWRVPKNPSAAASREAGHSFEGFPCDIALFDSVEYCGDPRHIVVIIECKRPGDSSGISELETYLGLEARAHLGIWCNGEQAARVYKLPSGGFRIVEGAGLPRPTDNLILAGETVRYDGLRVPGSCELRNVFESLLNVIVSSDGRTTRPDARLKQICNLLLVKLASDAYVRMNPEANAPFQLADSPAATAARINAFFCEYRNERADLFAADEPSEILFDATTLHSAVAELQMLDLAEVKPDALSLAFQVFRKANLKVGDGQYFTPARVIAAGVRMLGITNKDKVIDPACGTGGFLSEAFLAAREGLSEADSVRWATNKLYGVDIDDINVKLTRALMVGIGDGSTNIKLGDSIRQSSWGTFGHALADSLADESYTVVVTNPPFGKGLQVSARDASLGGYTICKHTKGGSRSDSYCSTEIGILFVERAWRLLRNGGRLGIVLPETYFFSKSYEWFREWIDEHFALRGVLNIPMEAFQGFCRAKTNYYVLQKHCDSSDQQTVELPAWFSEASIWVSNAPTIGINKDGAPLYEIDPLTHRRTQGIDDAAEGDVNALVSGQGETTTAHFYPASGVSDSLVGVPQYCDKSSVDNFRVWLSSSVRECIPVSLGKLHADGLLVARNGHGSPSLDFRTGHIPYIKVSDLRNGLVNENNTNMVSKVVAERFWGGKQSGLAAWDILTPARASKNIGEPVMLLPGQEDIVVTKEVLVLRPSGDAPFDSFYLMWALSLPLVSAQWKRVVLMQTNREDLGGRWREIEIPFPQSRAAADVLSSDFKAYYEGLSTLRKRFLLAQEKWNR